MMAEKTCVKVLVEENGEHGFDSYRVPGIVTASNGDLLLAYEGGLASAAQLGKLGQYVERLLHEITDELSSGNINADPCSRSPQESGSQWYHRKEKNFFIILY